jgi:hypothetical protein
LAVRCGGAADAGSGMVSVAADRAGWGGISGAGSVALPRAGAATAQGLIGVQPLRLASAVLSDGETVATV